MPNEGSAQPGLQALALPASTRARLAWRTPAMTAAQALYAGLPLAFPPLARANRLLEWHGHLAHRFRPESGVMQTHWEFGAESEREGALSSADWDLGPGWGDESLRAGLFATISPLAQRPQVRAAPLRATSPAGAVPREAYERSAELVPPIGSADPAAERDAYRPPWPDVQRAEAAPGAEQMLPAARGAPPETLTPTLAHLTLPHLPEAPEEPGPRLRLSVSPSPRRTMMGPYPHHETPVMGTVITERTRATESGPAANETVTPGWEAARQAIAAAALQMSRPGTPEAKPELPVEDGSKPRHSVFPLHLLTASEREARDRRIADEAEKAERKSSAAPAISSAPAPALDINAVADKVSDILMRRQRFERERKG